jgi:hypothetical protein
VTGPWLSLLSRCNYKITMTVICHSGLSPPGSCTCYTGWCACFDFGCLLCCSVSLEAHGASRGAQAPGSHSFSEDWLVLRSLGEWLDVSESALVPCKGTAPSKKAELSSEEMVFLGHHVHLRSHKQGHRQGSRPSWCPPRRPGHPPLIL